MSFLLGLGIGIFLGAFFFYRRHRWARKETKEAFEEIEEALQRLVGGKELNPGLGLGLPFRGRKVANLIRTTHQSLRSLQEESREENARVRAVLEGMVDGLVYLDQEGRLLLANREAIRLLELPAKRWMRGHFEELLRNEESKSLLRRCLKDRRRQDLEMEHHNAVLEMSAVPLEEKGVNRGAILVLRDVTSLRELQTGRRAFVANVSHEFRTPLTAILGYLETVLHDPDMPREERVRILERVFAQAQRLEALVLDLLQLARIESSPESGSQRKIFSPRVLMGFVVEAFRPQALEKSIELSLEDAEAPARILSDEDAVRQILENLVSNAIRYTPEGGRVRLRCKALGEDLCFEVEDTGIGIAPQHLSRIFERFYRTDPARTRFQGGTGLGLAIVKHLSQRLGGRVQVRSEVGEGSTFSLHLPGTVLKDE
ncbi:MAG TPA: PAS domain-containing protein [Planctomycetes bacterium]|nr:PAS domain-containing protein [Planctomycetota bacterium]